MRFLREKVVLDSAGFRERLVEHEAGAMRRFRASGRNEYVTEVVHRLDFMRWGIPLFDDWAMLLRTDIVDGRPSTAFFLWGMGIVLDERAPVFFGNQLDGAFGVQPPLAWFNRLEPEGLACGYWVNLTESPETSFFSRSAGRMSRAKWHEITRERHLNGLGRSAYAL